MNKEATISFRLDDKTVAELDQLADLQGTARTAIIREAIAKHLKVQPPEARSDVSKCKTRSNGLQSRIDVVEAELGELGFLISDLYRLYARSVDRSPAIEAVVRKLLIDRVA
jgi:Ribbon-helix-helix protein, copG family